MKILALFILSALLCSCSVDRGTEVNDAMKSYDKLITHLATDSLAQLYATDGEIAGEGQSSIVGRDSIQQFLRSFAETNVKVLSYVSTTDSMSVIGDAAIQYGSYNQIVRMPSGDTLELGGKYIATWVDKGKGEWRIKKMFTHHYRNIR